MYQPLRAPASLPDHEVAVRGSVSLWHLNFKFDGDFLGPSVRVVEHVVIYLKVEIIVGHSPAVEEQVQGSKNVRLSRVVLADQNGQFTRRQRQASHRPEIPDVNVDYVEAHEPSETMR